MADAESLREVAHVRAPLSTWFGIVLLFALFGMIVLAVIGPSPRGDNYEQKRARAREEKLKALREDEAKSLAGYAWIDKNKGTARIPMERAIELTVAELKEKKPALAGPIIASSPPATPPQSATPAVSASPSSPKPSASPKPIAVSGAESENRGQPAAAANPPNAQPSTQPGAKATPAASPTGPAAKPAISPSPTPVMSPPGSPLPVRGKSPAPEKTP